MCERDEMAKNPIEDGNFSAHPVPISHAATRLGLRICLLVVVWGLFVSACFAPAFHGRESGTGASGEWHIQPRDYSGWGALLWGEFAATFQWSANVFLMFGSIAVLMNRIRIAAALGVIAALAACSTWVMFDRQDLLRGSYIWAASQVTFAGGTLDFLFASLIKKHTDQKPQPNAVDTQ
jgi:hypothetical protein